MLSGMVAGPPLSHPMERFRWSALILGLGILRQMLRTAFPVHESVLPCLDHPVCTALNLPQQCHDSLLQGRPARRQDGGGLGELLVDNVVGQDEGRLHFIAASPNVGLLTEQGEAGHGHQNRLHVDGPEVHEENYLQFYMCLTAYGNLTANISIVAMPVEELVSAHKDVSHPLQDVCVVQNLVLYKFLRHGEQHL